MDELYAVIRAHGPGWKAGEPLEAQDGWGGHAAFMDALTAAGNVVLAGPLGEDDALIVVRANGDAEVEAMFASDPWTRSGLLKTTLVAPWTLRIGRVGSGPAPSPASEEQRKV